MRPIERRTVMLAAVAALAVGGCATSTVQSRIREQPAAYASLSPEFQKAVAQGELKEGMSMDAVYIAWGKPFEVFKGHSAQGPTTTWVYMGTQVVEYPYWAYSLTYGYSYPMTPTIHYAWGPYQYARAEVVFVNGRVSSWRKLAPAKNAWPKSRETGTAEKAR